MEEISINSMKPGGSLQIDETDLEKELTQKFLRGEISFADYSNEWYARDNEEGKEYDDYDDKMEDDEPNAARPQLKDKAPGSTVKRRRVTRLTPALLGLMGQANIQFVRGEKNMAEKMCYEIIRQVPNASEPYQTLAQIYEHDMQKHLQFSLLAAHLSPRDANEWLRLAEISKQMNDARQEMLCYTQAIKAEPQNVSLHMKRLDLLTALESINFPLKNHNITHVKCYHTIVNSLPASEGETIMKYAKMAAAIYHDSNEIERALEVMATAYKKCASLFTLEDTNLFLELLIARKQYQTCIEVFVANAEVEIEAEIQTIRENNEIVEHTNYLNCRLPNNLPIDLKCKLLICFIHLRAFNLVKTLLRDFLSNDVERAGDLYMDIEEALSSVGQHELALLLLEPLVKHKSFDLGAVWLKHAECLYNLGRVDDAIKSYYKVLEHAPQHSDARRKLFSILENKNCIDEALRVLQQDRKLPVSAKLLHQELSVLKKYNKLEKYLEIAEVLLSRTFMRFRYPEELKYARSRAYLELIHNFRTTRGEKTENDDDVNFDEDEPFKLSSDEEWDLFNAVLRIAYSQKNYSAMERLSFGALTSKSLLPHQKQIEFYCLQACFLNQDYTNALPLVKDLFLKNGNIQAWNLLNIVSNLADENMHTKTLVRLFNKNYHHIKNLFLGNNYLISGRYVVALKYHLDYHERAKDPLSALLIAVSLLCLATSRTVDKHHNLILNALAYFWRYKHLRNCDQEAYYNIGKAYQMLSINNLAIEYYEKAIACPPPAVCEKHGSVDLTRECVYNLCLIYKDHSPHLAQKYMMNYLVI